MRKNLMIMAICAVIAIGMAMPLSAMGMIDPDDIPGNLPGDIGNLLKPDRLFVTDVGSLESNTSKATAGLFTNDIDDYMSVNDYAGVLGASKWFGFVSGKPDAGGVLDLGYARNLNGTYLGIWYRGNIFRSNGSNYVTKTVEQKYRDPIELLTTKIYTTSYEDVWNETVNNIEFLIGVSGMGIKVGFFESTSDNKNEGPSWQDVIVTDHLDGHKDYENAIDNYTNGKSYLKPYIGWGGNFGNLHPSVTIGFGMYGDKLIYKYSDYSMVNGVKKDVDTGIGAGQNYGYMEPYGEVGAWLDLAQAEGKPKTSVGFFYGIKLNLVDNEAEGLGKVKGFVSWDPGIINNVKNYADNTVTGTNMEYDITELSHMEHSIALVYKAESEPPIENLKLGFMAAVPVQIVSESTKSYSKQIIHTVTKYNWDRPGTVYDYEKITHYNDTETFTLGAGLHLALGASYQLIPNRFGINAGISADPVTYVHSVRKTKANSIWTIATTKEIQDDGSVTINNKDVVLNPIHKDEVDISDVLVQYNAALGGGFTFNFNSKASLDLAVESGGGLVNNLFSLNLTTVNVIFTFKF
jgi:hypothetical protein